MASDDTPDIVATASRVLDENRWRRVREDATRRRDGETGDGATRAARRLLALKRMV